MNVNAEIGQRIRHVRQACDLSQSDVGARLTKPRSHVAVSHIERGKTAITVELLSDLAGIFGVPLVALIPDDVLYPYRAGDVTPYRRYEP